MQHRVQVQIDKSVGTGLIWLLILAGFFLWVSCNDLGTQSSPANSFAMYRLLDTTVTASAASTLPLDELVLAPVPFITARDLIAYY